MHEFESLDYIIPDNLYNLNYYLELIENILINKHYLVEI